MGKEKTVVHDRLEHKGHSQGCTRYVHLRYEALFFLASFEF